MELLNSGQHVAILEEAHTGLILLLYLERSDRRDWGGGHGGVVGRCHVDLRTTTKKKVRVVFFRTRWQPLLPFLFIISISVDNLDVCVVVSDGSRLSPVHLG